MLDLSSESLSWEASLTPKSGLGAPPTYFHSTLHPTPSSVHHDSCLLACLHSPTGQTLTARHPRKHMRTVGLSREKPIPLSLHRVPQGSWELGWPFRVAPDVARWSGPSFLTRGHPPGGSMALSGAVAGEGQGTSHQCPTFPVAGVGLAAVRRGPGPSTRGSPGRWRLFDCHSDIDITLTLKGHSIDI